MKIITGYVRRKIKNSLTKFQILHSKLMVCDMERPYEIINSTQELHMEKNNADIDDSNIHTIGSKESKAKLLLVTNGELMLEFMDTIVVSGTHSCL